MLCSAKKEGAERTNTSVADALSKWNGFKMGVFDQVL